MSHATPPAVPSPKPSVGFAGTTAATAGQVEPSPRCGRGEWEDPTTCRDKSPALAPCFGNRIDRPLCGGPRRRCRRFRVHEPRAERV
jgi:hypothetical protein